MEKDKLHDFFSGKATTDKEKEVLDWIESSSANQEEFIKERHLYNAVLLHSDDTQKPGRHKTAVLIWAKEIIKVAAMLAVVIGMYFHFSLKEENDLRAMNIITVPLGQRVDVELPDGSKVCVNAGSELKYPSKFAKGRRVLKLSGEAFFDVAHDSKKPFIVETELCDVEALGTVFNIEAYPNAGKVSTSLLSGKVKVTDKKNTDKYVVLLPDQEVGYSGGSFEVNNLRNAERLRWKEGLICFQELSLGDLLKEFEKYYDVQIRVTKKEILNHELSGKLKIGDGIDHALRVVQKSIPFDYVRNKENDNAIIIK